MALYRVYFNSYNLYETCWQYVVNTLKVLLKLKIGDMSETALFRCSGYAANRGATNRRLVAYTISGRFCAGIFQLYYIYIYIYISILFQF